MFLIIMPFGPWPYGIFYDVDCQIVEKEAMVESEDGNISSLHSAPNSQNVNSDSGLSVGSPNPKDGVKDDSKFLHSPFNCDNKSSYSSVVGLPLIFSIL